MAYSHLTIENGILPAISEAAKPLSSDEQTSSANLYSEFLFNPEAAPPPNRLPPLFFASPGLTAQNEVVSELYNLRAYSNIEGFSASDLSRLIFFLREIKERALADRNINYADYIQNEWEHLKQRWLDAAEFRWSEFDKNGLLNIAYGALEKRLNFVLPHGYWIAAKNSDLDFLNPLWRKSTPPTVDDFFELLEQLPDAETLSHTKKEIVYSALHNWGDKLDWKLASPQDVLLVWMRLPILPALPDDFVSPLLGFTLQNLSLFKSIGWEKIQEKISELDISIPVELLSRSVLETIKELNEDIEEKRKRPTLKEAPLVKEEELANFSETFKTASNAAFGKRNLASYEPRNKNSIAHTIWKVLFHEQATLMKSCRILGVGFPTLISLLEDDVPLSQRYVEPFIGQLGTHASRGFELYKREFLDRYSLLPAVITQSNAEVPAPPRRKPGPKVGEEAQNQRRTIKEFEPDDPESYAHLVWEIFGQHTETIHDAARVLKISDDYLKEVFDGNLPLTQKYCQHWDERILSAYPDLDTGGLMELGEYEHDYWVRFNQLPVERSRNHKPGAMPPRKGNEFGYFLWHVIDGRLSAAANVLKNVDPKTLSTITWGQKNITFEFVRDNQWLEILEKEFPDGWLHHGRRLVSHASRLPVEKNKAAELPRDLRHWEPDDECSLAFTIWKLFCSENTSLQDAAQALGIKETALLYIFNGEPLSKSDCISWDERLRDSYPTGFHQLHSEYSKNFADLPSTVCDADKIIGRTLKRDGRDFGYFLKLVCENKVAQGAKALEINVSDFSSYCRGDKRPTQKLIDDDEWFEILKKSFPDGWARFGNKLIRHYSSDLREYKGAKLKGELRSWDDISAVREMLGYRLPQTQDLDPCDAKPQDAAAVKRKATVIKKHWDAHKPLRNTLEYIIWLIIKTDGVRKASAVLRRGPYTIYRILDGVKPLTPAQVDEFAERLAESYPAGWEKYKHRYEMYSSNLKKPFDVLAFINEFRGVKHLRVRQDVSKFERDAQRVGILHAASLATTRHHSTLQHIVHTLLDASFSSELSDGTLEYIDIVETKKGENLIIIKAPIPESEVERIITILPDSDRKAFSRHWGSAASRRISAKDPFVFSSMLSDFLASMLLSRFERLCRAQCSNLDKRLHILEHNRIPITEELISALAHNCHFGDLDVSTVNIKKLIRISVDFGRQQVRDPDPNSVGGKLLALIGHETNIEDAAKVIHVSPWHLRRVIYRGSGVADWSWFGKLHESFKEEYPYALPLPVKPSFQYDTLNRGSRTISGNEIAQRNLLALRTLQDIEAKNRKTTEMERNILAEFSGWNALPAFFDSREEVWEDVRKELKDLMTKDIYLSMQTEFLDVPLPVNAVRSIWTGLARMGIPDNARILETTMGFSSFFASKPDGISAATTEVTLAKHPLAARILPHLKPEAFLAGQDIETTFIPNNFFDAVLGQIPHGKNNIKDYDSKPWQTTNSETYYFIKTLDKLRHGGVMVMAVDASFMDATRNSFVRRHISSKADLLCAMRVPMATAGDTPNTIDVLFLRKRAFGEAPRDQRWQETISYTSETGRKCLINEYYMWNPAMLLQDITNVSLSHVIQRLPTDVFGERTTAPHLIATPPPQSVKAGISAQEAIKISFNQRGQLDFGLMSTLTGLSPQAIQKELGNDIFLDPETVQWVVKEEYLSGNVYEKLQTAEFAAKLDDQYGRNVSALKEVQPQWLMPGDIAVRLGAPWIPPDDVGHFIAETLDAKREDIRVTRIPELSLWLVQCSPEVKTSAANMKLLAAGGFSAIKLIRDTLNGIQTVAYNTVVGEEGTTLGINRERTLEAQHAQRFFENQFSKWIWTNGERADRLVTAYNRRFNALRPAKYDGSHLTLPGINRSVLYQNDLAKHQKDAVYRVTRGVGESMLAHCTGAGKTFVVCASVMELIRLGKATKCMIIVPNHLIEQWKKAFKTIYPEAKVFAAGKDDFHPKKRKKTIQLMANGHFDAVIVSHSGFELIPVSSDMMDNYLSEMAQSFDEGLFEGIQKHEIRKVKLLEIAKERITSRIEPRVLENENLSVLPFDKIGIDCLFIDEFQAFINLGTVAHKRLVLGHSNNFSLRANDMHLKMDYLRRTKGKGRSIPATATPFPNSIKQIYNLLYYMDPVALRNAGINNFVDWATTFTTFQPVVELNLVGDSYQRKMRSCRLTNLPELSTMFQCVADIVLSRDLDMKKPKRNVEVVVAQGTKEMRNFVDGLAEEARHVGDTSEKNMLQITGLLRKAALDMRLINPLLPDHSQSKAFLASEKIFQIWEKTEEQRLTQLVCCDFSTPNGMHFNVYDAIRSELIKKGVPPVEIQYIHSARSDLEKQELFDAVNSGEVRILFGSTEKVGVGTNIAERIVGIHHIDVPWHHSGIEQREGRGIRPGNRNRVVNVYYYVTKDSFDLYVLQLLNYKKNFSEQIMLGEVHERTSKDIDGNVYTELMTIASSNTARRFAVDSEQSDDTDHDNKFRAVARLGGNKRLFNEIRLS